MWSSSRTILIVALLSALISACGFRLQGVDKYPPALATTYVDAADRYSIFYRELLAELKDGGITVTESPVGANATVRIESDSTGQQVLSVSGRNVPTEYNVYYTVVYSVWLNGEQVLPSTSLSLNQAYTYDATRVLGKSREEQAIRESLADNLVRQISQQLALL